MADNIYSMRDEIIKAMQERSIVYEDKINLINKDMSQPIQNLGYLYQKWMRRDVNNFILNRYGYLLSKSAYEIASTLLRDGWDDDGYSLLIIADRLANQ